MKGIRGSSGLSSARHRVVLFGMYDLGYRVLETLLERALNVVGIVTKPDILLEAQPLVRLARSSRLPVFAPVAPRDSAFLQRIRKLRPGVIAVAGYHKIFPRCLLSIPPRGVMNLHGSLLPRHRGPVPWKWSILNGETKTGLTVHEMVPELDRGPILSQRDCRIDPEDTGESLFRRMCSLAGPLLAETLLDLEAGRLQPRAQDERQATYESYVGDEDARIRWDWDAERIRNLIRGLSPRPGAWTEHGAVRLRIQKAALAEGPFSAHPGMILRQTDDFLIVSTGRGNLAIGGLIVEGDGGLFEARGFQGLGVQPGTRVGTPRRQGGTEPTFS